MINQEIINLVRTLFIQELEHSIQIYTYNGVRVWVNEGSCRELIAKLSRGVPTGELGPPLYSEPLVGILEDMGFSQGSMEHKKIRKYIEKGE